MSHLTSSDASHEFRNEWESSCFPRHGVVGVDGSPASFHALAYACGWAQRTGSELVVVYAADARWQQSIDACGVAAVLESTAELVGSLERQIDRWMAASDVRWTFLARDGDCVRALEAAATEHDADAIIVGQSRRRRTRRDTSCRLARASRRIVIAVP